ncbi:hypothetical protein KVR01_012088 [Diaporthe batatas]|uniref:uncharacterized protein n=1 Tax=Diaporthe batatas TaxID=748121 RepID=UPI001D04F7D4|nr:uncharacterized protein KVR01_012088 [Diaporthe batatas]KAG8158327.1 hypothetical protein KVR01_012088 [Diaporthe batatas]
MTNQAAQENYLAKPCGDCCITGHLHDGEPRGAHETIDGIDTYVVHPPAGKANGNIVLYHPDVFALFTNGQLVMDCFASAGYLTLDPGFDFYAWIKKHQEFADEAVPRWVDAVKTKYGKTGTKYASVGYCFGAPYVCDQLVEGGIASVGAFAHPAFLTDSHFAKLKRPLFLSCADTDVTFGAESRRKAVDILIADKKQYHLQVFTGVEHGFALRSKQDDPYEKWVREQSLRGIVEWFDYWLARDS